MLRQVVGHCSVDLSAGRPDSVDKSKHQHLESVSASTMTTMADDHHHPALQLLPPAVLRVTTSKTGRTAASSTPRGRALELLVGRWHDRPNSALSNFSELDSGYDELRSFTVTPIIPPELVITGPHDARLDLLPAEMTSSSVGNEPEPGGADGKQDDENDYDDNKSISGDSDLCRSEAFPEDRCNTSFVMEQEDLMSANIGTGNSSAVSLSSPDAADSRRLSANSSECALSSIFIHLSFLFSNIFIVFFLLISKLLIT